MADEAVTSSLLVLAVVTFAGSLDVLALFTDDVPLVAAGASAACTTSLAVDVGGAVFISADASCGDGEGTESLSGVPVVALLKQHNNEI